MNKRIGIGDAVLVRRAVYSRESGATTTWIAATVAGTDDVGSIGVAFADGTRMWIERSNWRRAPKPEEAQ